MKKSTEITISLIKELTDDIDLIRLYDSESYCAKENDKLLCAPKYRYYADPEYNFSDTE